MIRSTVLTVSFAASLALVGAATPSLARAQGGSIIGTVEDSLHGGALPQAGVAVVQLPQRHVVTSASGAFRIDSLPAGRYTLQVTHPVLDSLGIRLVSDTLAVAAGKLQTVSLSVPGARTLTSIVCTPAKLRFGPGVILGRVAEADTEKPAEGAEVSVAWTETEAGADIGIRSAPRLRKATVSADGTYRICGVPASFKGSLQATRGGASTAEVPIEVSEQALSMRLLYLPSPTGQVAATAPAAPAANAGTSGSAFGSAIGAGKGTGTATGTATGNPATGTSGRAAAAANSPSTSSRPVRALASGNAVIRGKVTNAGGVPVSDARVSVQGSSASTASNADGSFTLSGVPAGTQAVLVRRVGYEPVELPIDVRSRLPNELTVRLGSYTPQLATVEVKVKQPDRFGSSGFDKRRSTGMGKYMDEDQIVKIAPTFTSDVLRRVPGLYVSGSGQNASVTTTRGNGCVSYLVDRNPIRLGGSSLDDLVNASDVSAVEFYQPSEIPLELSSGSNGGCALLVIWTKREVRDPRKG
ncbi:MAG: carboxypeptidase regulatory-like domain-containing protein [Gemmatimonadaceae bacterium]